MAAADEGHLVCSQSALRAIAALTQGPGLCPVGDSASSGPPSWGSAGLPGFFWFRGGGRGGWGAACRPFGPAGDGRRTRGAEEGGGREGAQGVWPEGGGAGEGGGRGTGEAARHDFRGRGRAAVDQHDERLVLGEVARARIEALGFLGGAAAD